MGRQDIGVPELPEVEALARFLDEKMGGRRIERAQLLAIAALKTYDPPLDALASLEVKAVSRRGKFLIFDIPPLALVIHLARAGWIRWHDEVPRSPVKPGKSPLALRLRLDDGSGFDATEMGTEHRFAIYVVHSPDDIAHVATLGPDPLDPSFDVAALEAILKDNAGQIKGVLTDQALIAGVGNAYSDEALHMAHLSPFRKASSLSAEEVARLHNAVVTVLSDAVERSKGLPAKGLKNEKKTGLRVHGRKGEACPECGDTIREVSFATKSLQYCPTCQTGGKPLADRRLSKFLK
jgi:formamidopyrimidine-DNA glycosylase